MSTPLKLLALTALASFTLALAPVAAHAADDTVVAIINGDKILKKDVTGALKTLRVSDADAEKVFPQVLEQIVNEKLIDGAVKDAKIEESEDYKKQLDIVKVQLAKQLYIEKHLKSAVTEGKIKSEYDKFKAENAGKEEVHARHILVPTEEEAKQVIKDLDGGAKFVDLATKRSSGPTAQNGGDLGYFVREEMVPEFADAAFKLKAGSYTKEPVKTKFGYHVIMVEEKRKRSVPGLKEVEAPIRNKLGQESLMKLVGDLRKKSKIELFDMDGKPLAAAPAAPAAEKAGKN